MGMARDLMMISDAPKKRRGRPPGRVEPTEIGDKANAFLSLAVTALTLEQAVKRKHGMAKQIQPSALLGQRRPKKPKPQLIEEAGVSENAGRDSQAT